MMSNKENNFNLIRLMAASQVLVVHVGNHFGYDNRVLDVIKLFPGVPIFYFISGYLIYQSFDRLGFAELRAFYLNRIVRIYPGLVMCTALSVLVVYLTGYFHDRHVGVARLVGWLLAQTTFLQFYNPPFMRGYGVGVLNGALWTIAVEIQFYLLVPLLYHALHKKRWSWVAAVCVSLAINLATRNFLNWDSLAWKFLYTSCLPWIYMFLVGFGVSSRRELQDRILRLPGALLVPAFLLSMLLIPDLKNNSSNAINPISFLILTTLVLKVAFADLRWFGRLFQKTDLSYGLYLYHMPMINLMLYLSPWSQSMNAAAAVTVSVGLAALSWILVEKPALDLKKRFTRRRDPGVPGVAPGA